MTIFDCCMFLNENDLYEIRLNQHWDFVDKFIVVEAGETHTGLKKPLNFDHKRFEKYASKIEYRSFDSFDEAMKAHPELLDQHAISERGANQVSADWTRDHFQYNYIYKVLQDLGAKDEDIIYISCCDEILGRDAFDSCADVLVNHDPKAIFMFHFYLYAYKFNLLCQDWSQHISANLLRFSTLKNMLPATMRNKYVCTHRIQNAGWHFTFLDNTDGEMVLEKQRSWAHSKDEYAGKKLKFENKTKEEAMARFFEDYNLTQVEIKEGTHPKYILDNLDKFKNFIY